MNSTVPIDYEGVQFEVPRSVIRGWAIRDGALHLELSGFTGTLKVSKCRQQSTPRTSTKGSTQASTERKPNATKVVTHPPRNKPMKQRAAARSALTQGRKTNATTTTDRSMLHEKVTDAPATKHSKHQAQAILPKPLQSGSHAAAKPNASPQRRSVADSDDCWEVPERKRSRKSANSTNKEVAPQSQTKIQAQGQRSNSSIPTQASTQNTTEAIIVVDDDRSNWFTPTTHSFVIGSSSRPRRPRLSKSVKGLRKRTLTPVCDSSEASQAHVVRRVDTASMASNNVSVVLLLTVDTIPSLLYLCCVLSVRV